MATGKVRTSTPGSREALKRELKEGNGNDRWFYRVPANDEMTGRFMAEPWEFTSYLQHFINKKSFPCNDGDCLGCDEGNQARKVWVAPVVDVKEKRVRAMQVPKSIVDELTKIADRAGTIMDRDITVIREGSTQEDTKYTLYTEGRKRRDMSIFEAPDIEGMLEDQLADALDADVDDEDDAPPRRKSANKKVAKSSKSRSVRDKDEKAPWEDEDEEDERPRRSTGAARKVRKPVEDDDPPPRRSLKKVAPKKTTKSLRRR